jgi:type VI protein secretion system component Hcp
MPLHYFLKIDGLKGDSTVEGFEGWFSVDGYDNSPDAARTRSGHLVTRRRQ